MVTREEFHAGIQREIQREIQRRKQQKEKRYFLYQGDAIERMKRYRHRGEWRRKFRG